MKCKTCNSKDIQRLSVIYEQGTFNIRTTSRHFGMGSRDDSSGFGLGSGTTLTSGTSQSIAARMATPPKKKLILIPIVTAMWGLFFMMKWLVFGGILVALACFLFWKFFRYNKYEFPALYSEWENSWACNKCGDVFVEEE